MQGKVKYIIDIEWGKPMLSRNCRIDDTIPSTVKFQREVSEIYFRNLEESQLTFVMKQ